MFGLQKKKKSERSEKPVAQSDQDRKATPKNPAPNSRGQDRKKSNANHVTAESRDLADDRRRSRNSVIEASDPIVKEVLAYAGGVITAEGGSVKTTAQQREVIAVLEDGTCLVKKNDYLNPHILEVKAQLTNKQISIRREFSVERDIITRVYLNHAKRRSMSSDKSNGDEAQMQKDFLNLIADAAETGTSDIHILVNRFDAVVQIRTDGDMEDFRQYASKYATELITAAFNMADESESNYKPYDNQAARISEVAAALPPGVQAIRLQFNPAANSGRELVCRLLYANSTGDGKDIDALGYSKGQIRDIKLMRKKPEGIVVIAGPTGSGKSTTLEKSLSALIHEKRRKIKVCTIEDPPEFLLSGAVQYPVTNAETEEERSRKFTSAISAALRSDPDVIMIGEVRDPASSKLAFTAAMTGHQVWTSLHANNAFMILDRFRDQGVERYKIINPELVIGLISQRLLKKLCPHCKIPLKEALAYKDSRIIDDEMHEGLIAKIGEENFGSIFVRNENGCDHENCRRGAVGRTVAAETIVPDDEFMKYIAADDIAGARNYWQKDLGGFTLVEHGIMKLLKGEVDPRDVELKVSPISRFDQTRLDFVLDAIARDDV